MNLRKIRKQRQPKLMIIPMIDIIFFLLVFFMMSTLYMADQKSLSVQLPQANSAEIIPEQMIAVTILADGKIMLDQQEIARDNFAAHLSSLRQSSEETPLFVLYADKKTQYSTIVFVLDELKNAGLDQVAFATTKKVD